MFLSHERTASLCVRGGGDRPPGRRVVLSWGQDQFCVALQG